MFELSTGNWIRILEFCFVCERSFYELNLYLPDIAYQTEIQIKLANEEREFQS